MPKQQQFTKTMFNYRNNVFILYFNLQREGKKILTLRANCFKRLYLTNCLMLFKTDISIGMSDASPPSLTHGCAGKIINVLIPKEESFVFVIGQSKIRNFNQLRNSLQTKKEIGSFLLLRQATRHWKIILNLYKCISLSSTTKWEFLLLKIRSRYIHKAWAAVSLARGSFTNNFLTKSLALLLMVGHGLRRKSGLFLRTWSMGIRN